MMKFIDNKVINMKNKLSRLVLAGVVSSALMLSSADTVFAADSEDSLASAAAAYGHQVAPARLGDSWDPAVKAEVEDFVAQHARYVEPAENKTKAQQKRDNEKLLIKNRALAVVEMNQTAPLKDIAVLTANYQIQHLAFGMTPDEMEECLKAVVASNTLSPAAFGKDNGNGRNVELSIVADDILKAYTSLYSNGLVSVSGIEDPDDSIIARRDYQEFTAKMAWLFKAIHEIQPAEIAVPWLQYWSAGFTPYAYFRMSYNTLKAYDGQQPEFSYTSSSLADSSASSVNVVFNLDIKGSEQLRELATILRDNVIDVAFVSSYPADMTRAALDYYKIPAGHGMVAGANKLDIKGIYTIERNDVYHRSPATIDDKLKALQKDVMSLYKVKAPQLIITDDSSSELCKSFQGAELVIQFNDDKAVDAIRK